MGDTLSSIWCGEVPSVWCVLNVVLSGLDILTDLLFFSTLEADEGISDVLAYCCLLFSLCGVIVEVLRYAFACRYNFAVKARKEQIEQHSLARVRKREERRRELRRLSQDRREDPTIERELATEGPQHFVRKTPSSLSRTPSSLSNPGAGAGAGFIGQDWSPEGDSVNIFSTNLPGMTAAAEPYIAPPQAVTDGDEAFAALLQMEEEERVGRAAAAAFPRSRLPELQPIVSSLKAEDQKKSAAAVMEKQADGTDGEDAGNAANAASGASAAAVMSSASEGGFDIEKEAINWCCGFMTSYKDADDLEGQQHRDKNGEPERMKGCLHHPELRRSYFGMLALVLQDIPQIVISVLVAVAWATDRWDETRTTREMMVVQLCFSVAAALLRFITFLTVAFGRGPS